MRSKDLATCMRIIEAVERYKLKTGGEPSFSDIAAAAGLSKTRVHAYVHEMADKGIIDYSDGVIETPRTRMISASTEAVPVVGTVKCGEPVLSEENVVEYVRLPVSIFGDGDYYLLNASGDSMADAGIEDGDTVVIEYGCEARIGDVVTAIDGEGQNTLKRLGNDAEGRAALLYENAARYPSRSIACETAGIQGVARYVIKKL